MVVLVIIIAALVGVQSTPLVDDQTNEHSFVANSDQDLFFSNGAQITSK